MTAFLTMRHPAWKGQKRADLTPFRDLSDKAPPAPEESAARTRS
jgi:hypothetical protein